MGTQGDRSGLGLGSGVALVVSNMVGAGVFLSAGYMAQDMRPSEILLAWLAGGVFALAGTRSYGQVAVWIPRSGGEYRYLSDLLHPLAGYLAGWASLLIGFSAPIAISAVGAGAFVATLIPGIGAAPFGITVIAVLTAVHARGLRPSKWAHNSLALVDVLLLGGFVLAGLLLGRTEWPTWTPLQASDSFAWTPFANSLLYVGFAYSGWNAAVYAASEFQNPARDVPRAMLIGASGVTLLYLLVNWVFVANLDPASARAVFDYEATRVTLGHVLAQRLLGEAGGTAMSLLAATALVAGASAMLVVGPRVTAGMADDGYLPRALGSRPGAPPVFAVVLQGALAALLAATQTLQEALASVGAVLTFFAALVSVAVLLRAVRPSGFGRPDGLTIACASVHAAASAWVLVRSAESIRAGLPWIAGAAVAATIAWSVRTFRSGVR